MWRYTLLGRHSNRTPLSYPAYQTIMGEKGLALAKKSDSLDNTDVIILGQTSELRNEFDTIFLAKKTNPSVKIVVFSEEPLWDTVWSGGFLKKFDFRMVNNQKIEFHYFNHTTTDIFNFCRLPYFITTDDNYLTRYRLMFARNCRTTPSDLMSIWKNALYRVALFLEKRTDDQFSVEYPQYNLRGLCQYRTQLAESITGDNVLRVGKGWDTGPVRQSLPDWHLEKISRLDGQSRLVSAIENTHQENYITEKIFDAYAVNAIPFYYASEKHRIFDLLPPKSFINLYGKSVAEAVYLLQSHCIEKDYVELFLEVQRGLSASFSDVSILDNERESVCIKIDEEILKILS